MGSKKSNSSRRQSPRSQSPQIGGPQSLSGQEPALSVAAILAQALPLLHDSQTCEQALTILIDLGLVSIPPLLDRLHHPDPQVRRAAAWALGRIADRRWSRKLVRSAHWTYQALQEPGAYARLLQALIIGSPPTRVACAVALGRLGDPGAQPELFEILGEDHLMARLAAIWALGEIGDKLALPHLADALHDPEKAIQQAAAAALGKVKERIADG